MAFFPEGTFWRSPGLRPFRLGAFAAATAAKATVLPVAIAGTRAILRDGEWLARRGPVTVTIDAPVPPSNSPAMPSPPRWRCATRLAGTSWPTAASPTPNGADGRVPAGAEVPVVAAAPAAPAAVLPHVVRAFSRRG